MKLYMTPTSPYARAIRILVRELDLLDQVAEEHVALRTAQNITLKHNPTGKVPTLIVAGDVALSEGVTIARYLTQHAERPELSPDSASLEMQALAGVITGFVDGVSVWVREARRPLSEQSPDIIRQERERAERCVRWLDTNVARLGPEPRYHIALLAAGLDRLATVAAADLLASAQALGTWAATIEQRPAFADTLPAD